MFIRSRRVVTPEGVRDCVVHVEGGKIVAVLSPADAPTGQVDDVGDLVLAPGIVDPHVHINEPGRTEWEGFESATRAAAAGGVTTLVDMPLNSSPVTTSVHALQQKLAAAAGKLHVDCGFHAGLVPEHALTLAALLSAGVLGVKAFLIGSGIEEFPPVAEHDLRSALPAIASRGLPLLVHAELCSAAAPPRTESPRGYAAYLAARPRSWENNAVELMVRVCREYKCRVHIVHVSSSDMLPMLRAAKEDGVPITAETCPHYLFFSAEEIPDGATHFKCAPPIRERANNELLWDALKQGVLDCIVSDHSPCPPALKLLQEGDFVRAWGGISSLQLSLAAVWTEARKRNFGIEDLARWMSSNTAKLVGLENRKGAIAVGRDADFVLWNPNASFVVQDAMLQHRHKLTPYAGRTLFGKVHATFLRGEKVYDDGRFFPPVGQVLLRN